MWSTGCRHGAFGSCSSQALEHRLSPCVTQASLSRGTWDLPDPGVEPVSSAQAGRFFTTEPPEGSPSAGSFASLLLQHVTYLPVLSHCTGHCPLTKAEPHAHPTPSVGDVRWPGGFHHIPGRISPTAASHGHHAQQRCLSLDPHKVGLSCRFPAVADTETPPSWASVSVPYCVVLRPDRLPQGSPSSGI